MTMREEFETWASGKGLPIKRDASGTYWAASVEDLWESYQAAYAAGQRAGRIEERGACAITAAIHSMHPAQSSYEVGYGDGRKAAADAIRNRSNA